jgi:hypothetical protein
MSAGWLSHRCRRASGRGREACRGASSHRCRGVGREAVEDDGLGGAVLRRGTGLVGLADRARSHGGVLEVMSHPGVGTSLRSTLPCG